MPIFANESRVKALYQGTLTFSQELYRATETRIDVGVFDTPTIVSDLSIFSSFVLEFYTAPPVPGATPIIEATLTSANLQTLSSYASWLDETEQHLTFAFSDSEMEQTVGAGADATIYALLVGFTSSGSVVLGQGTVLFVNTPLVAPDPGGDGGDAASWVDWEGLTVTGSVSNPSFGAGTVTEASYAVVGNSLNVRFTVAQNITPGTAGSGDYRWSVPMSIDTMYAPAGSVVGVCSVNAYTVGVVRVVNASNVEIVAGGAVVGSAWMGADIAYNSWSVTFTVPIGVWSGYSPVITAVTANPTKDAGAVESASYQINSNNTFGWVSYHLTQASPGTAGTGDYRWSLPFTVDTNFCPIGTVVGTCMVNNTVGVVRLVSSTTVELVASAIVSDAWLGLGTVGTWSFQASLPISS